MNLPKTPWWVIVSILLSAGLSLFSLSFRYKVEQSNKAVTIAAEMEAIEALATAEGSSLENGIWKLKEAGLGAIVTSEETVGDLFDQDNLRFASSEVYSAYHGWDGGHTYELAGSYEAIDKLARALKARGPHYAFLNHRIKDGSSDTIGVDGFTLPALRSIVVGLQSDISLQGLDIPVIARFSNPEGTNTATVAQLISEAKQSGAEFFLPMGDQVLGRRENLDALVNALRANGMMYCSPEFAKLGGDANVLEKAPEIVLRLHSAQTAELDKMTESAAIERYSKAASERGMRVLLLRPLSLSAPKPLTSFEHQITALRNQLQREGLALRKAHPYTEPNPPRWVFPAIGLAAAPAIFFVLSAFLNTGFWLGFLGIIILAVGAGAYEEEIRPFTALACAIAFPTLSFILLNGKRNAPILLSYVHMTVTSVVGGLCVGGLLNSLPYMIHSDQFFGVKLAHYLPVALVGWFFLSKLADGRAALKGTVTWTQAALFIVVLAALGLMFLRTGNDNPEAVSGIELRLRSLLESIMVVRPRTKEILIGHPALIIGLGMLALLTRIGTKAKWLSGWTALALTLGTIGQTSIVNTLCHIHTPLIVSLTRIGVGTLVGGIIGALAWAVLKGRLPKAEAQP